MGSPTRCVALFAALLVTTPSLAEEPAAPEPAAPPPRLSVLALDLEAIDVDKEKLKIINGTVVDVLSGHPRLEIIAQEDIRQMVDLDAEKQAMGCDTMSCLADIAGAMGAQYVVFGRVGRLDDVLFVQLNLFDSGKGRAVAREELRAQKLSELPDLMRPALARLVAPLTGETPPAVAVVDERSGDDDGGLAGPLLWSGAALAGVGLLAGAGLTAGVAWAELTLGDLDAAVSDKDTALDVGPWLFAGALGSAAVVAGGLALSGAAMLVE